MKSIIFPEKLQSGDTVAILSPASIIRPEYVAGAVEALARAGYQTRVMPHTLGTVGSYSGSAEERIADFVEAWRDPEVKAILCSRGGYGCIHLLDALETLPIEQSPKWLIGFSDVSALHAFMASHGVVSIHGSMAKSLALHPLDYTPNAALLRLLGGERQALDFAPHHYNRPGVARGRLVGGNLAVLQALMRSPYDIFQPSTLLFIEDIGEAIYKVQRMVMQLRLAGLLNRFAGIVVGRFTEYNRDKNHASMEDMLAEQFAGLEIPIAFDAPIGHVDENMPLLHGAEATLTVTSAGCSIAYESV